MLTRLPRRTAMTTALMLLMTILVVSFPGVALAAPPVTKLGFTTSAQTSTAGVTSGTITVQLQTSNSQPGTLPSTTTVNLTTSSSGGVFRNTADSANITSISIAAGTSSGSFKYKD
ncbi:MAG: hypothetical protein ACRDH7_05390, partial [Actinomycetota bacterium]